jgi:hypothetical protein
MESSEPKKLIGVVDRYKGLEIADLASLENDEAAFDAQLAFNLELWRKEGIRSV